MYLGVHFSFLFENYRRPIFFVNIRIICGRKKGQVCCKLASFQPQSNNGVFTSGGSAFFSSQLKMVHKSGFGLFTEAAIIQTNSSILLSVAIIDAHTHALKEALFFSLRWVSVKIYSTSCSGTLPRSSHLADPALFRLTEDFLKETLKWPHFPHWKVN